MAPPYVAIAPPYLILADLISPDLPSPPGSSRHRWHGFGRIFGREDAILYAYFIHTLRIIRFMHLPIRRP